MLREVPLEKVAGQLAPAGQPLQWAPGVRYFCFQAVEAGETKLVFSYARPGEQGDPEPAAQYTAYVEEDGGLFIMEDYLFAKPRAYPNFVVGARPLPVAYDPALSEQAGGWPVRLADVNGSIWRLPQPAGFTDIESATLDSLPVWVGAEAINLSSGRFAYFVPGGSKKDAWPKYSLARLEIVDGGANWTDVRAGFLRNEAASGKDKWPGWSSYMAGGPAPCRAAWMRVLASASNELLDQDNFAREGLGRDNADPEVWELAAAKICTPESQFSLCLLRDEYIASFTLVPGSGERVPEMERRKEELQRLAKETAITSENPSREELERHIEAQELLVDELPPGGTPLTRHDAAMASLFFPCNGKLVNLTVVVCPASGPEDFGKALSLAQAWRERLLRLNGGD